jgi:hypothetical protein
MLQALLMPARKCLMHNNFSWFAVACKNTRHFCEKHFDYFMLLFSSTGFLLLQIRQAHHGGWVVGSRFACKEIRHHRNADDDASGLATLELALFGCSVRISFRVPVCVPHFPFGIEPVSEREALVGL